MRMIRRALPLSVACAAVVVVSTACGGGGDASKDNQGAAGSATAADSLKQFDACARGADQKGVQIGRVCMAEVDPHDDVRDGPARHEGSRAVVDQDDPVVRDVGEGLDPGRDRGLSALTAGHDPDDLRWQPGSARQRLDGEEILAGT